MIARGLGRLAPLCFCLVVVALTAGACAPATPPVLPSAVAWRQPDVPRELATRSRDVSAYAAAWNLVRAGDLRAGERSFGAVLTAAPDFYPAIASLGELRLHARQYQEAVDQFARALALNARYLPALVGMVDARLGAADDAGALTSLQALIAVDPSQSGARARLDVVRLRVSQSELAEAERLRRAGRLDEADAHLRSALAATPQNGLVLQAMAAVAMARGALDVAEARAREATTIDSGDAAAFALLGDVLEARDRSADAAAAYASAVALDPRPAWVSRLASLREKVTLSTLPEGYRTIATSARVNRAQVAAALGIRLQTLLTRAPARVTSVVTDVRGHWAMTWIMSVVRAGWIDALPNHTFQPAGSVTHADLARVSLAVLTDIAAIKRTRLDEPPARSAFVDVPRDHAAYRAVSIAVSTGIMTVDATNRFQPAVAVTGAELLAVISRLESRAK